MRLLLLALLPLALAKSVLVTFPEGTPDDVIRESKESLEKAGGTITHTFNLIKGYSAEAPDVAIQQVSPQSGPYKAAVEDDSPVSIA
ncbi:hypothetical protein BDW42DRAFT_176030 [Aspergillus taichungensis]|uniref:Inhibitor I9 domain-containing protein n=1 Tax=Aspergillus taichungensis TaxID=482145 RepID=A0A2J5HL84_9EURO|nr:hypothetical protein BDW42DRAFT_176030 [Aspergillus taichungensis]